MWWLVIPGIFLLLLAAVVESYCAISRQSLPSLRAKVFSSYTGLLFQIGWGVLLLIACVLFWFAHPIAAIVGVAVFWVLLPLWLMPMMKRRMLPPWEVVKGDLGKHGYTEDNYLSGDWWKKGRSQEIELHLKSK